MAQTKQTPFPSRPVPGPGVSRAGWGLPPVAASDTASPWHMMATLGYVLLLLAMFVTLHPFTPPAHLTETGNIHQGAGGDGLRQVVFLVIFALSATGAIAAKGLGLIRAFPPLLLLLLAWCVASAYWADDPEVVLRRALLASIVTLSILMTIHVIGPKAAFRYLRIMLVVVLVVNWLSIPLIPSAVHLPGETDPGLVGNWRGLYSQKNTAGAVSAVTAILFLFRDDRKSGWGDFLVIAGALAFLVMTRSKTSMALFPIASLAGLFYRMCWRVSLDRAIFCGVFLIVLVAGGTALAMNADTIARMLENPAEFTGRAEIWQADFAFIRDHVLQGAGFGSVAGTNQPSFLRNYVNNAWVITIGDSHSGYLQTLVELGAVGAILAISALIIEPLVLFWPLDAAGTGKAGLFAVFVFVVLHDFTESDFLESDNSAWFVFLVVLAGLRMRTADPPFIPAAKSRPPIPG